MTETMTHEFERNGLQALLEIIGPEGVGGMQSAMTALLNEAMRLEREAHLGARSHERTEVRTGYANGFEPKTIQTRVGEMTVQAPQTRDSGFLPLGIGKWAALWE